MNRIVGVLISLILITGTAGCGTLAAIQIPSSQLGDNATSTITQPPADTPTPWPTTTFQFPATWTPNWIKPATETPVIKSQTPASDETPGSNIATPLYPTGLFTIIGTISQKTSTIPFKASTITIVWKYSGAQGEQSGIESAASLHKDRLNSLYTTLNQALEKLNANLADANNQNNTTQISYWTDQIKQTRAEYQQQIDKESIRYQTQIAKIITSFSIQINRISVNKPFTLVTAKGHYIGQVTYKTVSASDYYFTIQASGPFQIDITR